MMGPGGPFGIVTKPEGEVRRACVVMLNSGLLHRVGPSRLYVDLCRQLSEMGFISVRIDIAGKGDTPRRQGYDAEQSVLLDYDQTCKHISNQYGVQQFIVLGLCSGADDAFLVASSRNNVVGMAILDGYAPKTPKFILKHFGYKALRISAWLRLPRRLVRKFLLGVGAAETSEDELDVSEVRNFPTIAQAKQRFEHMCQYIESAVYIYTAATKSYYNYQGQLLEVFDTFKPSRGVREVYMPAAKHTFPLLHHRLQVTKLICDWAVSFQ